MIDIRNEELVTFSELARRRPRRRKNRPVHVSTIHRWRKHGLNGVCLEATRAGGGWITSMQAFERFCRRLSESSQDGVTAEESEQPTSESLPLPDISDDLLRRAGF